MIREIPQNVSENTVLSFGARRQNTRYIRTEFTQKIFEGSNNMSEVSLARQVDFVFRQLEHELTGALAGTVLIIVRNDTIGKFGIKHHPIHIQEDEVQAEGSGLTKEQVDRFRVLAVDALKMKRNWTHGEILYDFSVRSNRKGWSASVLYESNYNMSTWNYVPYSKRNGLIDYSS